VADQGIAAMRSLLDELISLSRLEAGKERVSLEQFDAHLPVQGDPGKVHPIAQNLAQNALRYTAEGYVRVTWTALNDGPAPRWCFIVQDTGPGLAGKALPIAHALKKATDEARVVAPADAALEADTLPPPDSAGARRSEPPGEGIGLAIVKRMCMLLDAQLELHSARGTGSTFRVVLPRRYP
jgi:signal transduction histidine kinase